MSDSPEAPNAPVELAPAEAASAPASALAAPTAPAAPSAQPLIPANMLLPASRDEVGGGLAYIHGVVGANILAQTEVSAHLYALTELLVARGVISLRDFEQRKADTTQAMMQQTLQQWPAARVHPDELDKYEVEPVDIDCLSRLHLCKASCCRLSFNLSRQDLAESVVQWDFSRPYHIKQRPDGYCVHCAEGGYGCTVRENRPIVCRQYDCRADERIWQDFEKRIPNPEL